MPLKKDWWTRFSKCAQYITGHHPVTFHILLSVGHGRKVCGMASILYVALGGGRGHDEFVDRTFKHQIWCTTPKHFVCTELEVQQHWSAVKNFNLTYYCTILFYTCNIIFKRKIYRIMTKESQSSDTTNDNVTMITLTHHHAQLTLSRHSPHVRHRTQHY